jgi:acyl dehydratase
MKYFEDFKIGDRTEIGSHQFNAGEIKSFAKRFDPQRFHVDEAEAERSHFGKLCASGWHTAFMWMRTLVDYRRREADARRSRGEPVARTGPSPGFRDLKWLKPVYAGDTVSFATEVVETRPSNSRPEWGIMRVCNTGTNQNGDLVISFVSATFVERRPSA